MTASSLENSGSLQLAEEILKQFLNYFPPVNIFLFCFVFLLTQNTFLKILKKKSFSVLTFQDAKFVGINNFCFYENEEYVD